MILLSGSAAHLQLGDLAVRRAGFKQFFVGTAAGDPAVLQHQDQVRMLQAADALCHDHLGGAGKILGQSTAQCGVGFVIQCAGAVIQQ